MTGVAASPHGVAGKSIDFLALLLTGNTSTGKGFARLVEQATAKVEQGTGKKAKAETRQPEAPGKKSDAKESAKTAVATIPSLPVPTDLAVLPTVVVKPVASQPNPEPVLVKTSEIDPASKSNGPAQPLLVAPLPATAIVVAPAVVDPAGEDSIPVSLPVNTRTTGSDSIDAANKNASGVSSPQPAAERQSDVEDLLGAGTGKHAEIKIVNRDAAPQLVVSDVTAPVRIPRRPRQ